ncbi:MAG: allantoin permease [Sulfobacillus benefaciens]|uniref:Allantoin permease n=1 Tax=Sulfobacillus benefaciens TaxID=453960 RepID=A0A2T2XLI1_9FIRM|nr:MAG: allantoin permease [Sulfobacillus benefaciens]
MSAKMSDIDTHDRAFHVETNGINIIPEGERHGKPRELFNVWLAAELSFSAIIIGELFTAMGLNILESLAVSAVCVGSFVILGWASLPGAKTGTATLTITRAIFGIKGNRLPAAFSWINNVGWEAVNMVLTVYALLALFRVLSLPSAGILTTLMAIIVGVVLTFSIPILGHETVVVMQRVLAYILGALSLMLIVVILPHVHWNFQPSPSALWASGPLTTMIFALSIGLMSTVFSWTNYASDYTRYMPSHNAGSAIVRYTWLGSGLAAGIELVLGVLLGSFVSPKAFAANPVGAIMAVLPTWYVVPFLIVVIVGLVSANYLNSYSSGMSFLAIGVRMKRHVSVVFDSVIAVAITLYALFIAQGFLAFFQNFLGLSILVIGPWTGMFLADFVTRKGHYDRLALVDTTSSGRYWYSKGTNWTAITILLLSSFLALWTVDSTLWESPVSKALLGGMDLSAFVGPLAGFVLYKGFVARSTSVSVLPDTDDAAMGIEISRVGEFD